MPNKKTIRETNRTNKRLQRARRAEFLKRFYGITTGDALATKKYNEFLANPEKFRP